MLGTTRTCVLLTTLFAAQACGEADRRSQPKVGVGPAVTALTVGIDLPVLEIGAPARGTAVATYSDGTTRDVASLVTWSSSTPEVAAIDSAGNITAVGAGITTITAALGAVQSSAQLTVTPAGDPVVDLRLTPSPARLEVGATLTLLAQAVLESGATLDVTAAVTFTTNPPGIASVDAGVITGVAAGGAVIEASYQSRTWSLGVEVTEPIRLAAIELSETNINLGVMVTRQLTATGILTDASRMDLTNLVTWTSSNPAVATISTTGLVTSLAAGEASIVATYQGTSATANVTIEACAYPSAGGSVALDRALPNMSWVGAYDGSGNTVNFSTEQFFCDPQFDAYTSMHVVVGAGWCPNCPAFKRNVNNVASQIAAAGGLVVYVEIENDVSAPASHAEANSIVNRTIPGTTALRIGDGETMPRASLFGRAVSAVPGAFVIRKSDMMVVADQGQSSTYLDFVALAQQINGGSAATCGPSDEESFEPNDDPTQAGLLSLPADFMGGVCAAEPDFYRIDTAGAWTANLTFSHAQGDLDIYVFDTNTNMVATDANGDRIGSESADDNESFSHSGPATVIVLGYQGATAPYRLTIAPN